MHRQPFIGRLCVATLMIAMSVGTGPATGAEAVSETHIAQDGLLNLNFNSTTLAKLGAYVTNADGAKRQTLELSLDASDALYQMTVNDADQVQHVTGAFQGIGESFQVRTDEFQSEPIGLLYFATSLDGRSDAVLTAYRDSDLSEPALWFAVSNRFFLADVGELIVTFDVGLAEPLAEALGVSAKSAIGSAEMIFRMRASQTITVDGDGEVLSATMHAAEGPGAAGGFPTSGPDVIVGDLPSMVQAGREGPGGTGTVGLSIATTSCNKGDEPLIWQALPNTNHPMIPMNLYRLRTVNGSERFEQIGQAWMKHAFAALQLNACGFGCSSASPSLGVGCSDPYCTGLNASQCGLGARAQLNPYTGEIPGGGSLGGSNCTNYPSRNHDGHAHNGSGIEHRLQVQDADLMTSGSTYYGEGHYVTPHEFQDADSFAGQNMHNNVSYRRFNVSGGPSSFSFSSVGGTVREEPAVNAWPGATSTLIEPAPMVDGRAFLYYEVTDLGGGTWHYEYAVYNMNLDRSIQEFTVPIPGGVSLSNIGFHAPLNHDDAGVDASEQYSNDPWTPATGSGEISWTTETLAQNTQANAIRFGTLYNFRFDANAPPQSTNATVGYFKLAGSTAVATMGPAPVGPQDCNANSIEDTCDIDCSAPGCNVPGCGRSADCDGDGIPDDCETFPTSALDLELVATGLSSPLYVTAPEGDDRLFIVQQGGQIRILDSGSVLGTPFLNIDPIVLSGGEQGLLGLAFHPDYASNGLFYVNYTNNSGNTVVAEYQVSGNPNIANGTAIRTLLTISQPFPNHNGGWIGFGPDGYLYVATGDGGSGNDPGNRSQDITGQLLGKMLRLDPDNGTPGIPPSNPFVGVTGDDEIWAYGLRNPWRCSFDRLTGDLWIGDVGQNAREEIDYQPSDSAGGENYGWRCMEGFNCTGLSGCTCNAPALTLPVHDYPHSLGFSVTGGYVYRGCDIPDLNGTYFYADYGSARVWSFRYDGSTMTEFTERTSELSPPSSLASFGEDGAGELYIVSLGGTVWKIIPEATCGNGIVETGEECDPPNGTTCDSNCDIIPTMCGDGILQPGEDCDDGNTTPGDGCDENCNFESNDDCEDATPILEGNTAFTTVGATTDGPAHPAQCTVSGDGGQTFHDIWFVHTATCTGNLTISTCNQVDYDSDLVIYNGTNCNSLNFLACNDDGSGCSGFSSDLTAPVTAGQDYLIRVGGWNNGDQGSGTVTISNDGTNCDECDVPADCDDGNPCTDDDCVGNVCVNTNDNSNSCSDGNACTQTDTCSGGTCVGSNPLVCNDGNVCTTDSCNPASGCVFSNNSNPCNDGDACTSGDTCSGGSCSGGSPTNCDDGNSCTTDSCDPIAGCQSVNNTDPCDDGDSCTENDVCSGGSCQPGTPPDCLDTTCTDCNLNNIRDDCEGLSDCNLDGIPDDCQFADCNSNSFNDICEIAVGAEDDCDGGPVGDPAGGAVIFGSICFACHAADGSGGFGPNIQNYARWTIWNQLNPPTTHTGGVHDQFDDQDLANIEAFLSQRGSRGRPDWIPDSCQTLPDCDGSSVADGCELEDGTLTDSDFDGIPDNCSTECLVDADCNDLDVCTHDQCNSGACDHTANTWGDVNHDNDVDLFDIICMLDGYQNDFSNCSLEELDIAPCEGNGDIDLFDVFAVLDAFSNQDDCCGGPAPAPPTTVVAERLAARPNSSANAITVTLETRRSSNGEQLFVVAFAEGFVSLRAYQIQVVATDELGTAMPAASIEIDDNRRDYAFAGWETVTGVDTTRSRALAASMEASLSWNRRSYLGEFVFDIRSAKGAISMTLGAETVMIDDDNAVIEVESPDRRRASTR